MNFAVLTSNARSPRHPPLPAAFFIGIMRGWWHGYNVLPRLPVYNFAVGLWALIPAYLLWVNPCFALPASIVIFYPSRSEKKTSTTWGSKYFPDWARRYESVCSSVHAVR